MTPATADIAAVRDEIAELLQSVGRLNAYAYDPTSGELNVPAAIVTDVTPRYNATFGAGYTELTVRVRVEVGGQVNRSVQRDLDELLANSGSRSIRAALEDVEVYEHFDDLSVISYDPVGFDLIAELGFYGGVFTLLVSI